VKAVSKTSDERFEYAVYSNRFGFSVGRRKKQGANVNIVIGGSGYESKTVAAPVAIEKQETS
jgi:hypothetical protein